MTRDLKAETKVWVDKWRQDHGVGPNVTPSKDKVPFKWMHPYLNKVKSPYSGKGPNNA